VARYFPAPEAVITVLQRPLAELLVTGGDHRLTLSETTKLSKYRVFPGPRTSIPLGSCTASSPSTRSMAAAAALRDRLREAADPVREAERAIADQRRRLVELFELPDDVVLPMTPSGTDAIYLVSCLALRRYPRVHHVVVGASELGGGTLKAARGQGISAVAPFGPSDTGAPLPGLAERCSAAPVYLRDGEGRRLEPEQIDAEVRRQVEAVPEDCAVVVHLVAHSKTGLRAPSTQVCSELSTSLGDRLTVLVDAAQGRLAPRDVRRALALGFQVLFTGSKFYSGPPFSSVLVLPEGDRPDPGPLPESLQAWFARTDLPPSWTEARASLAEAWNPGLALRWEAALAEIEAYHDTLPRYRACVYHTFAGAVHEVFGPSHLVRLDVPLPPVHALVTALGAYPSVFGFVVEGPEGPLSHAALGKLHGLLDTDLSSEDPDEPSLGTCFHLGQPVSLGPPEDDEAAVLRVALGARLVTDLAPTADAGAAYLRSAMRGIRAKTEWLVRNGWVQ